jgi:hypothetical protein
MKFNSIIALIFVSQCLGESDVDVCIRENKCGNLDLTCLFGCVNNSNMRPNNWNERLECASKCPQSNFTQCTENCYNKKNGSSKASIASPLLYAAVSLSVFYWLG